MAENETHMSNFIHDIIDEDLKTGKRSEVVTRFPPEPNGYLHIGHAKAICLDFGTAKKYGGRCHLRFDDTNPTAEDIEYVEAIKEDVKWLGWDWGENLYWASSYFDKIHGYAVELIKKDKAYVCELSSEEFKEYRGVPTRPGNEPPGRNRTVEENLDLFERMKNGEFKDGEYVLRAKIDMASPNLHLRDPAIYRIKHATHHTTGDQWCIYPMYDFAHCIEDSIEGITHSMCTLEFEVHRPLYDWILDSLEIFHPQQIEFARLNLSYTIMSKRKLLQLVNENRVNGWDDPRMPTLSGLRRRGYTPESIRNFCEKIGCTKFESLTDVALLEHCLRDDLNKKALRVMGVLDPVKVVIDNMADDEVIEVEAVNNPEDEAAGTRTIKLTKEIYIEREDFKEEANRKYRRLTIDREVRLRYACLFTCTHIVKDDNGEVIEIHGTWDPESKGGAAPDGRKVKGTIHWASATESVECEVRMYDRLFTSENPAAEEGEFTDYLNPDSLKTVTARVEPSVKTATPLTYFQFERIGYFNMDPDATAEKPVFNLTTPLRGK
ncbi:glutamine--tRNA ligase/YqeY domain fusion protein [Verrucomicrobiota bacterium]